jgi:hypothetical protein
VPDNLAPVFRHKRQEDIPSTRRRSTNPASAGLSNAASLTVRIAGPSVTDSQRTTTLSARNTRSILVLRAGPRTGGRGARLCDGVGALVPIPAQVVLRARLDVPGAEQPQTIEGDKQCGAHVGGDGHPERGQAEEREHEEGCPQRDGDGDVLLDDRQCAPRVPEEERQLLEASADKDGIGIATGEAAGKNLPLREQPAAGSALAARATAAATADRHVKLPPKLLDETAERLTETGLQPFTPDYASPETFQGKPASTASDVYSLGVVLYELLTGTLPHTPRSRTPYDIARAVLEDEPMRPRTRVPTIPREMDAIVLMALRKEPNRRYPSVDYLRDDLEGYLAGQPVEAYRGNTLYRFSSFLRKNRVPLGVAALVVSVAVAGIAVSRSFARRAERHLEEAVRLAAHVVREIGTATQAGRQPEVLRIAQDTRARLTRLAAEGGPNQELLRNLLAVSIEVGELQGSPGRQSVGDTEAAVKTLEEAVMLGERLYQLNAGDIRHLVNLTRARTALGNILLEQQRYDEAEAHFERGRQITAIPAGSDRVGSSYRLRRAAYAVSLLNLAQVHRRRNEFEQMFSYQKQGLAIRREM